MLAVTQYHVDEAELILVELLHAVLLDDGVRHVTELAGYSHLAAHPLVLDVAAGKNDEPLLLLLFYHLLSSLFDNSQQ